MINIYTEHKKKHKNQFSRAVQWKKQACRGNASVENFYNRCRTNTAGDQVSL